MTEPTTPPRWPCPSGEHHLHPLQTCAEYERWRAEIAAALRGPNWQS